MSNEIPSLKKRLQPYFLISLSAMLAFAPLSFMLRAMKNDVIALEYPINHFMSQCIRNGEVAYWFNTWGMGFPLQSNITWGIFSTPQMLFSSLFNYNIYVLHIEFMFFIMLAGWSMFHLLHKYFIKDKSLALLLSICYMLSGFMVGSTQWLLYITAAAFVPLLISSLLSLLYTPSFKNAFHFAIIYTLMFTSVYAAFNIITTYSIAIFLPAWFFLSSAERSKKIIVFKYFFLASLFIILLCFPSLFYTLELLKHIDRGNAISTQAEFFNSNYLHPASLSNMLLPLSSIRSSFPNTEGTMLNTYVGLFTLILFPAAIYKSFKEKNKPAIYMLGAALLFLLIAFGSFTPLRNILNILPGFSYFRNPAIFRFYFILCFVIFLSIVFSNSLLLKLFDFKNSLIEKVIHYTIWILISLFIIIILFNTGVFKTISLTPVSGFIKNISFNQTVLLNSLFQLTILSILLVAAKAKKKGLIRLTLISDLVLNTLFCTPFFSVSSYSIPEVQQILNTKPGFPIQNEKPGDVAAVYTDNKNNNWDNVNVYSKKVSSNSSYRGPLGLSYSNFSGSDSFYLSYFLNKGLVFAEDDSLVQILQIQIQKPTHVQVLVDLNRTTIITLMQNYYPGWQAYYNNKKIELVNKNKPGISIRAPEGKGVIDFRYERKTMWQIALLLHVIVLLYLFFQIIPFLKRWLTNRKTS